MEVSHAWYQDFCYMVYYSFGEHCIVTSSGIPSYMCVCMCVYYISIYIYIYIKYKIIYFLGLYQTSLVPFESYLFVCLFLVCTHLWTCMWGQQSTLGVTSWEPSTFLFPEAGFLTRAEGWLASKPQRSSCLHLLTYRVKIKYHYTWPFHVDPGNWAQVLILERETLCWLSHGPSPDTKFLYFLTLLIVGVYT